MTRAEFVPPAVRVSGTFSYNRQPLSNGSIQIIKVGSLGDPPYSIKTDEHGRYSGYLDEPGRYSLVAVAEGGKRLPQTKQAELGAGQNTLDVSLEAGTVSVRLAGGIPTLPTKVTFQNALTNVIAMIPAGSTFFVREGMPIGEYLVYATQAGSAPRVSKEIVRVKITTDSLSQSAAFDLVENHSSLLVHDEIGTRIKDVHISSGDVNLGQLTVGRGVRSDKARATDAAGLLALSGFQPGLPILLHLPSPFVPVCRTVQAGRDVDVTASAGRRVTVTISRGGLTAVSKLLGSLIGSDGSDCPVPLSDFTWRIIQGAPEGYSMFAFENFPGASHLTWQVLVGGVEYREQLLVSDAGSAFLDLRTLYKRR